MIIKHRALSAVLFALGVWLYAPSAHAEQVQYAGVHPVTGADGEFCYIEVPHVHIYKPAADADVMYRVHDDTYHFVGDPVAFGYEGPKHPYYGHHPVRAEADVHVDVDLHEFDDDYCYLDGPHFHSYEPPARVAFELKGDAYWYVGKYPRGYERNKKRYARINALHAPLVYTRPVVVVEARPAAYVGPIVTVEAVPAVIVETPHVHADVEVVVPSVHVDIGVPGVIIDTHHDHGKHKGHYKGKKVRGWGKRHK